jgi:hypothetical protein
MSKEKDVKTYGSLVAPSISIAMHEPARRDLGQQSRSLQV